MTPEEATSRLVALTTAHNGLDQDVQDLQVLRKHDAQLLRTMRADLAEFRTDVEGQFEEVKGSLVALANMIQILIDRDNPKS
jgi:hypothetical protein